MATPGQAVPFRGLGLEMGVQQLGRLGCVLLSCPADTNALGRLDRRLRAKGLGEGYAFLIVDEAEVTVKGVGDVSSARMEAGRRAELIPPVLEASFHAHPRQSPSAPTAIGVHPADIVIRMGPSKRFRNERRQIEHVRHFVTVDDGKDLDFAILHNLQATAFDFAEGETLGFGVSRELQRVPGTELESRILFGRQSCEDVRGFGILSFKSQEECGRRGQTLVGAIQPGPNELCSPPVPH